jgi:hypothetical protein
MTRHEGGQSTTQRRSRCHGCDAGSRDHGA